MYSTTPSPLVRNFALVYVEMAFARATAQEKAAALTLLLKGAHERTGDQQSLVLRLACDSIQCVMEKYRPAEEKKLREECKGLMQSSACRALLLSFISDLLKYGLPKQGEDGSTTYLVAGAPQPAPAGLSPVTAKRVAGSRTFTSNTLGALKLACLNFLPAVGFASDEMLLPAVIACEDGNHSVSSRGDELFRRALHAADLEAEALVLKLFRLYLGAMEGRLMPTG